VPVERYVDELMDYFGVPYYAGLLTAASFYGSSHQSPQVFQVMTNPARRAIQANKAKIIFHRKKSVDQTPVIHKKTATGFFKVSTPEATFFDMIDFNRRIGGLDHVALVASELTDTFTKKRLLEAVQKCRVPTVQRGGYLLERLGFEKGASAVGAWLRSQNPVYSYLDPPGKKYRDPKNGRWKLIINEPVEIPG